MVVGGHKTPRARLRQVAWCSSVIAIAAIWSGEAQAQCAPNPSQAGVAVTCSGTTTGGYSISTDQSPLTVTAGSSVQASGDALTVAVPGNSYYDPRSASITVAGSVISTGGNGILFTSGPSDGVDYDYFGTSGSLTIAAGGSVSGVTGITLTQSPGALSAYASASLSIDNSGTITGTGGTALASAGYRSAFSSISNEASGYIGAIAASFGYVDNLGTIDGGAQSAIATTAGSSGNVYNVGTISGEGSSATIALTGFSNVSNSGTIINGGTGAAITGATTVANQAGGTITASGTDVVIGTYLQLTNNGTITNTGTGQAVSGSSLNITNNAGGTISAGSGGIAIDAGTSLQLVNAGTIDGDVHAGSSSSSYSGSSVDSSQGTINGNLVFGDGSNTLVATLTNGLVQTGVTGTITGGTGTNTLQLATTSNATLANSVSMPTNFNQISFAPGYGTTLTLADGFSNPGTIIFNGAGALTNATTLSGTGQIVSEGFSAATFDNTGTISSDNVGGPAAIGIGGYASLVNSGTITATGDAVSSTGAAITNTGTISAGATAVSAFAGVGTFNNSGSIISTGGTALVLSAGCSCATETNSGTISGAQIGVQLSDAILVNSGTITSSGYGIALSYYGTVKNLAGGVISGGTAAIGNPNGSSGLAYVSNAGTINGDVDLANSSFATNAYYAVTGGILNGNLTLGVGDTLITDLANPASNTGTFAGITGTVNATSSNLLYNVAATTGTVATTPAGFSLVGYQLSNDATLTFDSASALTATLGLAGTGTVVFDGTIATTDAAALASRAVEYTLGDYGSNTALAVTNNGSIAATRTDTNIQTNSAVSLGSADTLVNNGTIAMIDTTGAPNAGEAAISGGYPITNAGTISGTGAGAVNLNYGYGTAVTLTNSGTITSDRTTIQIGTTATIDNSGTIAATGASPAIADNYYYGYAAQINNLAGGVISADADAIDLLGGTVSNAGTITGNVNLAYSPYGYPVYSTGAYYANGGTLNGNLTLSANEALVMTLGSGGTGPLGGVTGTIDANGATLAYLVDASATTSTIALPAGFASLGYVLSNNPTLTFTSDSNLSGTLGLAGSGSVIFNGTIASIDAPALQSQPSVLLALTSGTGNNALTITNNGTIATTADGLASAPVAVALSGSDTLINNGTISLVNSNVANSADAAVSGGLAITNGGTITGTGAGAIDLTSGNYYYGPPPTLVNTGTITSDQSTISVTTAAIITNSGSISSTGFAAIVAPQSYNYYFAGVIDNLAGGVITGATDAIDVAGGTINNAGTINGNVSLVYSPDSYGDYSSGAYYDLGGTLNGNLTLGHSDALVVALGSGANAPLGGVNGTIYANGASLVYTVDANATTSAASLPAGFATVGYVLGNNSTLTLTGDSNIAGTLGVAGSGSVIFNGTITSIDATALQSQSQSLLSLATAATTTNALTITNNGTIAAAGDSDFLVPGAVVLGSGDTLINNGTISLSNTAAGYTAVTGGVAITNTGNISGHGADAIALGSGYGYNIAGATLTNSGTIASDQTTIVIYSAATITNSGTIGSTGSAAIGSSLYSYNPDATVIDNQAGGTIAGAIEAIDILGGTVSNAGTITGNVNLAYSPYGGPTYATGSYFDNGGTLNGNLTLNDSESLVTTLSTGARALGGVTGTINANGASLIYIVDTSATVAPSPTGGFGAVGYQLANDATLTVTTGSDPTLPLRLAGSGAVILDGTIATTNVSAVKSVTAVTATGPATTPNTLTITNNGALSSSFTNYGASSPTVSLGSGDSFINNGSVIGTGTPAYYSYGAVVTGGQSIVNTGTIIGSALNAINLSSYTGSLPGNFINSGSVTSDLAGVQAAGNVTIANSGTISAGTHAIVGSGEVTIINSGTISSASAAAISIGSYSTSSITNLAGGTISGAGDAVETAGGTVSNAGIIYGNVNLGYVPFGASYFPPNYVPAVYIANGGTLYGNLTFASTIGGNELIETGSGYGVSGTIDGGFGTNYVGHLRTSNAVVILGAALPTDFSQEFTVASGAAAQVTIRGPIGSTADIFVGGDGAIINQANTTGTIEGLAASGETYYAAQNLQLASFTNQATVGSIALDAIAMVNSGTVGSATAVGTVLAQSFTGPFSFQNSGTIQSLGATAALGTYLDGTLSGAGLVTNTGTIAGGLQIAYAPVALSGIGPALTVTNSGTITGGQFGGTQLQAVYIQPGSPDTAGDLVTLTNSGVIDGNIDLGATNDTLLDTAAGSIIGNLHLATAVGGTGTVTLAGAFTGDIDGGQGSTSLAVSGGSAAQPVTFGSLTDIASYTQTGGYATIAGTASLGGAAIDGGMLESLVGSTITTSLLTVGAGGSFASGGTVNGNVVIDGNLHVGASPDTMTVNGNVTLASGSTSTFQVSHTASSKLVASGTVTIASGTTLQIVQLQPIMPGTRIDLIAATGGISGTFSTVSGISGQVLEHGGELSLMTLYDTSLPQNRQVSRSIAYINAALVSGNAPAALFAALPSLTTASGGPVASAFARLTPAAYASATQIGVENALTLSRAAREIDWASGAHSGEIFSFGQALGGWRGLDGDAFTGTATANISGYGFLGGLGLRHGPVAVAAFGGYLDQTQAIPSLADSTHAKGFVAGATARLDRGPARVAVSVLYDNAHADTQRSLFNGGQVSAGYGLHSWSLDGEFSTRMALGQDWVVRPHIGATWVWTRRGAATETANVFALSVATDHHTAGYVDGGLRFTTPDGSARRFTRTLDLGFRYQLQGRATGAVAGFADGPIALFADGVRRSAASALIAVGGAYRVTPAVSLFMSGSGEMTRSGNSANGTAGIRVGF